MVHDGFSWFRMVSSGELCCLMMVESRWNGVI